MHVASDKR